MCKIDINSIWKKNDKILYEILHLYENIVGLGVVKHKAKPMGYYSYNGKHYRSLYGLHFTINSRWFMLIIIKIYFGEIIDTISSCGRPLLCRYIA